MAKYAHIKDGAIYRIIDLTDDEAAAIPPHKAAYLLPYTEVARPAFDPATHHAPVRLPDDIRIDQVTQVWAVAIAKTAGDLDGEKDVALDRYDRLSFEVNFDQENRIRAVERFVAGGATPAAVTRAQYRNALKSRL